MDIFSVFTLLGGLAFFLFGMGVMGDGLENISGGRLERTLEKMSNNTFKGFVLGTGVTAVIQSSSATTVMVVGFVNSGIMKLPQVVSIIMGANVGTTITAWILTLAGLDGDSIFIKMLKPSSFAPVLAFIGFVIMMIYSSGKKRQIGLIFIGFALLMSGMGVMSDAVAPLADMPQFKELFTMFSNPILGILVGAVLTAVIQSSSASVGILQALSSTGVISFATAIPIIMGQNIGTCVTAMISCIGAKKNAKRAAFIHLYFNIIGTVVVATIFYTLNAFIHFSFLNEMVNTTDIAIVHTAFNLIVTALLLPFGKQLCKLACFTIKKDDVEDDKPFIDERLLTTPAIAIEQCDATTVKMAYLTKESVLKVLPNVYDYSNKLEDSTRQAEDRVDEYENVLGAYLIKLNSRMLSMADSKEISRLLLCIGEFERISDYSVEILEVEKELHEKKLKFSQAALEQLKVVQDALSEILELTVKSFELKDIKASSKVISLEKLIVKLREDIKLSHIKRLKTGCCTIELGFILSDLLMNYEKIANHCANIASFMLKVEDSKDDDNYYIHSDDNATNVDKEEYEKYKKKYKITK